MECVMSDFVKKENVFCGQSLATREEVLAFVAKKAVAAGLSTDEAGVDKAFLEREEMGETGMQEGFAIPHAKSDVIDDAGIIVVKLTKPVEWPSFDGNPVDIAIALIVPAGDAGTTHIKLLSQTAVMLMDEGFRASMRELQDPEDIADLINIRLD
jgi:PTS system fructose-specific IIA component